MVFPVAMCDVRVCKEGWVLKNWRFQIVVLEKTFESPLDSKEIKSVNPKSNQSWIFIGRTDAEISNTLATWWEELTHWKRPWCWERLRAGEGVNSGWDGWMASLIQWTWVWANFRRNSRGQGSVVCYSPLGRKVRHDLATEQQHTSKKL